MEIKGYEGLKLPKDFESFVEFYHETGGEICEGFELTKEDEDYILKTYSQNSEFLDSFRLIGGSDFGGSEYMFWLNNHEDLTKAPIVVFGGEGGYHVVASNFQDFLKILSYDRETIDTGWDYISYYKNIEEQEPSENAKVFHKWLKDFCNIDTIKTNQEIDELIKIAKDKYQKSLNEWVNRFYTY